MFHSEGQATFQWATQTGVPRGMLEIVIQEVLWSIRGSYSAIWSLPFTNVKWHSDPWPTVTSQPIRLSTNFMTLLPIYTFNELWVVSMEHLRRVVHASKERLPFRIPGSVPLFGTCLCSNCWDQIPRTCHVFTRLFTLNTPWYSFFDFASWTYFSSYNKTFCQWNRFKNIHQFPFHWISPIGSILVKVCRQRRKTFLFMFCFFFFIKLCRQRLKTFLVFFSVSYQGLPTKSEDLSVFVLFLIFLINILSYFSLPATCVSRFLPYFSINLDEIGHA